MATGKQDYLSLKRYIYFNMIKRAFANYNAGRGKTRREVIEMRLGEEIIGTSSARA